MLITRINFFQKKSILLDGYARFKCQLATCNEIVHENDIAALLDEREPALEQYMPIQHRRFLQKKQNKHSISAALPSADIKRCPMCSSIYMHEPGCNYVICANLACSTAWCWQCEKPIGKPSTHYTTASPCRLGYTDLERLLRCVQLVLDVNFIVLWIFFPFVYLIALLYIPIFMLFLAPASLAYQAYKQEKERHDVLMSVDIVTIGMKMIIGILIGILAIVPLAIGSIVSGFVLIAFYLGFMVLRTIPCGLSGDKVSSVLCLMRWAGRIFKIGPYAKLIDEARKDRHDAIVKLEENQDDFENAINDEVTTHDEGGTAITATTSSTGASNVEVGTKKMPTK
uniref:IBR domain-containing protein n=1 Tax=Caenorhabditis japonica TaxID=281687 RepID=A0A8R1HSD5_CAEJA